MRVQIDARSTAERLPFRTETRGFSVTVRDTLLVWLARRRARATRRRILEVGLTAVGEVLVAIRIIGIALEYAALRIGTSVVHVGRQRPAITIRVTNDVASSAMIVCSRRVDALAVAEGLARTAPTLPFARVAIIGTRLVRIVTPMSARRTVLVRADRRLAAVVEDAIAIEVSRLTSHDAFAFGASKCRRSAVVRTSHAAPPAVVAIRSDVHLTRKLGVAASRIPRWAFVRRTILDQRNLTPAAFPFAGVRSCIHTELDGVVARALDTEELLGSRGTPRRGKGGPERDGGDGDGYAAGHSKRHHHTRSPRG